jgi:hypothetical protein
MCTEIISTDSFFAENFMKGTYINCLPVEVIDTIYYEVHKLLSRFMFRYGYNDIFTKIIYKRLSVDYKNKASIPFENKLTTARRISRDLQGMVNHCENLSHYFNLGYINLNSHYKPNCFRVMNVLNSKNNIYDQLSKHISKSNIQKISYGISEIYHMNFFNNVEVDFKQFFPQIKCTPAYFKSYDEGSFFVIKISDHKFITYNEFYEMMSSHLSSSLKEELKMDKFKNAKKLIKCYYKLE